MSYFSFSPVPFPMQLRILFFRLFLGVAAVSGIQAQQTPPDISLETCFSLAHTNNYLLRQAEHSLEASRYLLTAERLGMLPKVDLLASYNYLSNPLVIDLQTVRNGVVTGSSQQTVYGANEIYREITGEELPAPVQQEIYNTSQSIIEAAYPDYNPELSQQQYFLAGLFIRQPIWLGGKLSTARQAAATRVDQGLVNQEIIRNELDFTIAAQYLRILYLNRMIDLEEQSVKAFRENETYVSDLVDQEMLPPYMEHWTRVLLVQARSRSQTAIGDKENALTELKRLMGVPSDTLLVLAAPLQFHPVMLPQDEPAGLPANPLVAFAGTNTQLARTGVRGARSLLLPNLFGIANVNLFQNELPVTTPPWMVGIELEWSLFDGLANVKRMQASKQLVQEAVLQEQNTLEGLSSKLKVARNRISTLQQEIVSIDSALSEARQTVSLVQERLRNSFASPRDVNDALLICQEIEKAYYTAVLGYSIALADYCNLTGASGTIAGLLKP